MERRNNRHTREFFEYSKSSRSRIKRALRQAAIERQRNSSSSDADDTRPRARNANEANHTPNRRSSSENDGASAESANEEADEQPGENGILALPGSDGDNESVFHPDGEDRNARGESPNFNDIASNEAEASSGQPSEDSSSDENGLDRQHASDSSANEEGDMNSVGHQSNSGDSDEGVEELVGNHVEQVQEHSDNSDIEDQHFGQYYQEEWNGPNNDNVPVYELGPLSLGESMYAILSFFVRHNLPQTCLADLLSLINLHCRPEGNQFPKTVHNFKKYFHNIQFPLVKRYYCSVCYQGVDNIENVCNHCHQQRGFSFFLEISIIDQLRALYKRPGFKDKLNHRFQRRQFSEGNYEDIYDGEIYKALSRNNGILANPSNISLLWYSDGVSVFRSSKYELWPFYFSINELPYNERSKISNALLAGLWFGKDKPYPSTFLRSTRDDVLRLRAGIQVLYGIPAQVITVKAIVIAGTGDLPAKAKFLNFKNFNGRYGCHKCKIASVTLRRGLTVYPHQQQLDMRDTIETMRHGDEAVLLPLLNGQRQDVFGVKGPSILSTFVHDYVRTTAVDIMHCAYINLAKSLLTFWFDKKFKDNEFSLYDDMRLINGRLTKITPPNFVQRLSRSLEELAYWKAHELKAFLLYYSVPILHDKLPELYIDHHKLLIGGLYLLNQRSVSQAMIELASELLDEYVSQFEVLYGLEHMTCNLHQLQHLASVTSDFGPLWVTSCFPYESLNGKLKKLVKGTRYAELQVCSGVSMLMKLAELKLKIPGNGPVHNFCENMFDSNRGRKLTPIGPSLAIVGKFTKKNEVPHLVRNALNECNIIGANFYEFYRLKKYCLVYCSEQYGRVVMTKSYCVKYTYDGNEGFGYIDHFLRVTNCDCPNFCFNCDPKYLALIRECQVSEEFSLWEGKNLHFLHTFHEFGNLIAVDIGDILSMCFVICIEDTNATFLVEPVNLIEAE